MASRAILALLAAALLAAALRAGGRQAFAPANAAPSARGARKALGRAGPGPAPPRPVAAWPGGPIAASPPGDVAMLGVKGLAYWTKPPYFTLWKVFVYYVVLQLVRKFLREGFQMIFGEVPNRKHTTSTVAELSKLHEFSCETCGYTIFPSRGREGKFFPKDFKCPECGADKKAFFDVLDPNDPRAIKYREEDEYFDYDIQKASGEKLDDAPPDKFTR